MTQTKGILHLNGWTIASKAIYFRITFVFLNKQLKSKFVKLRRMILIFTINSERVTNLQYNYFKYQHDST